AKEALNYLNSKDNDAFPPMLIADLGSEEAKLRKLWNNPAILGEERVPLARLQELAHDLEDASDKLRQAVDHCEDADRVKLKFMKRRYDTGIPVNKSNETTKKTIAEI